MPASKIQDQQEAVRWIEEGKTYQWMVETYREKYGIETSPSMWGMFRRRMGLERRITRNDELLPWFVHEQHRHLYPAIMLRTEARRRAGKSISEPRAGQLESFKRHLEDKNAVVHYDPDTKEGWFLVPRRPGVDTDMIRKPDRRTTRRPNRS